jgi:cardiolipin synthase A/B
MRRTSHVNATIAQAQRSASAPEVMGASGPLAPGTSKTVLASLRAEADSTDLLRRHLEVERAVAGSPLVAGNRTRLLRDGTETFRAMFAAIRSAKHQVNLEYYIVEDVVSDGERLSDLLIARRRAGVAVNAIYDGFGSMATDHAFFDRLKSAGVNLLDFNPVDPLAARNGYHPNKRDHRKILIVDGRLAIVGGVNLATSYESGRMSGSKQTNAKPPQYWRDTDLEIEGPAVAQLQKLFVDTWKRQKGRPLDESGMFPALAAKGPELLRVVGSTPDAAIPHYYATFLSALRSAERTVWATTAYFVPTPEELSELTAAARRGVDVRLLVPGQSDSDFALAVGQSHYSKLLEAGVRIYEMHGEVLHSKTAVIDGVWSVVGSSNIDHRSVLFNDEVDVVVLGRETADQLLALFEADLKNAREIDLETWSNRPFPDRLHEAIARIWKQLL